MNDTLSTPDPSRFYPVAFFVRHFNISATTARAWLATAEDAGADAMGPRGGARRWRLESVERVLKQVWA